MNSFSFLPSYLPNLPKQNVYVFEYKYWLFDVAFWKTGDASETIRVYFEKSKATRPANKSSLTMTDVDEFLNKLSKLSKEDEQIEHFQKIVGRCTSNDLKMVCCYGCCLFRLYSSYWTLFLLFFFLSDHSTH